MNYIVIARSLLLLLLSELGFSHLLKRRLEIVMLEFYTIQAITPTSFHLIVAQLLKGNFLITCGAISLVWYADGHNSRHQHMVDDGATDNRLVQVALQDKLWLCTRLV